ncbi:MAG: molecular chaperone DnaJ [Deltaproteobacteria bacterium]|nr:molecular chaperone DnaJ [Deltaproteobacteria bacterium]
MAFLDTAETCNVCGGDGRISSALGSTKSCPACHGSGRRSEDSGMRDVTKTKPSHFAKPAASGAKPAENARPTAPRTVEGMQLGREVKESKTISDATKNRLTLEIIDYEISHGHCTKTFSKKIRKQLRLTE